MRRSKEAFWWLLFAAGGAVSALLMPIHILLTGLATPFGWLPVGSNGYDRMLGLVSHPITQLYLLVLIPLSFFHCAHRLRHTLHELGLRGYQTPVAILCYGAAMIGTAVTGVIILTIP